MRALLVTVCLIALAGCEKRQEAADAGHYSADIREARAQRWSELLAAHGERILPVEGGQLRSSEHRVSSDQLLLFFEDIRAERRQPEFIERFVELEKVLDTTIAWGVPYELAKLCGPNEGATYPLEQVIFGVYLSGPCLTVRIVNPTPDAVRLLVGEEFVPLLSECAFELGDACIHTDQLLVEVAPEPRNITTAFGEELSWENGWAAGRMTKFDYREDRAVTLEATPSMTCVYDLPILSDPMECTK